MKYVFKENLACTYHYFGKSEDFEAEKKRNEGITFGRFEILRSILVKNTLCLFLGHEFRRRGLEVWVNGDFRLKRCFRCRSIMLNEIEFNNLNG